MRTLLTGTFLSIALLMTTARAQDEVHYLEESAPPAQPGDQFPEFVLTDMQYRSVVSLDLVRQSPVLLVYYRGGW